MTIIQDVKPTILLQWLEKDEAILIDAREPAEYQAERITLARNIPLSQITLNEVQMSEQGAKKLVIHCQSGRRSMMACEKLKAVQAPFDLWVLEGGIVAWKEAGLPLTRAGKPILPLDQQVHLTISVMILVGMTLGYFVSSSWFILPVVAGLGLLNAGLTGWCGLAKVMAKMPWNRR